MTQGTGRPTGRGSATRFDPSASLDELPHLVAAHDERGHAGILDDLPLPRFDLRAIDEQLRPAIADLVEFVVADLDDESAVPVRGGAVEHNVRQVTEHALRQFALAVESGSPQIDTAPYRELGRRHARAGWPLRDLTVMISRGGQALWRRVRTASPPGTDPDALLATCESIFTFTAAVSSAAVEGFLEASAATGSLLRRRRLEFARTLAYGAEPPADGFEPEAAAIGWRLPPKLAVAIAAPGTNLPGLLPARVLVVPEGSRWLLLVPATEDDDAVTLPAPDAGTIALGPVVPWRQAADSTSLAEELLELIDAGVVPGGGIRRCDDHATSLLLAAHPTLGGVLAQRWLAPLYELPEARREPLLETLEAWLESPGQYTFLAERLHVHVRTVRYRVDRLREVLGDVVDDPDQRLELALALRADRNLDLEQSEP